MVQFLISRGISSFHVYYLFSLGHVIEKIPELPLVVADKVQEIKKTKEAVIFLRRVKAWSDVLKVSEFYR